LSLAAAWAVGVAIILFLVKSRANYLRLPELGTGSGTHSVTVIIPARNEEHNIERSVRSFHENVIVVDDGSTDATAERARAAGATVIQPPPLKLGMLGKPNACLAGANASQSEWLLFVDADTWYENSFAPSLISYAKRNNLDMVSVFPKQECVSAMERILLPYAFALYFCGVHAENVNNAKSAEALANGQCMLFLRSAYDAIGGHASVASSVIEDVALARVAKKHGLQTRVLRAEGLGHVRMYDSFASIWRGFQKNSFRFLLVNPISGLQVIAASILLTSYLPVLVWLLSDTHWAAAVAFFIVPIIGLAPWYGWRRDVILAPAAIYLFQLIALNGMLATLLRRSTKWKGRNV
jgi:cellulose synthase/poly-beta-1,6-N-acetylglucosamine synthase-like glycosyltransferase